MEVEELFGCWSLLLSAVEQPGISYRDQKMTKGDSRVFGLEMALLMTCTEHQIMMLESVGRDVRKNFQTQRVNM